MMERVMSHIWRGEDVFAFGNVEFEVSVEHSRRDSRETEGHEI